MALCWDSSHEVFVPEIDAEHRALFRLIGELRRMIKAGGQADRITAGVRGLRSEMEAHFGHEERMMTDSAFWGFSWHKGQHETARKHLRNLRRADEKGDPVRAECELKAMSSWLNDHSATADRILGSFLRNHGRAATAHR
jgi:hemerythrin-like metal-binding protein